MNITTNTKLLISLVFMIVGIVNANCQKQDTIFYSNKNIRTIEIRINGEKILNKFLSKNGENLLLTNDFRYEYFDSIMQMSRILEIKNKRINTEFWYTENDTIYNIADFGSDFDKKITKFNQYLATNLLYPKAALNNQIEGRVMMSFIVDKTGFIKQIKPLTDFGYGLEGASVEILNRYKKWGIIYLNSKPINCFFQLPINYRL